MTALYNTNDFWKDFESADYFERKDLVMKLPFVEDLKKTMEAEDDLRDFTFEN